MENENLEEEVAQVEVEQKSSLHQVTPLSKYLAMALFVILPFVGGYVGYNYAPEKVVESITFKSPNEVFESKGINENENTVASNESIIFPNSQELSIELPVDWDYIQPNVYDDEGRVVFSINYPIREVGYEPLEAVNVRDVITTSGLELRVVDRVERQDQSIGFAHYMVGVQRDWDGDFLQDSFEIMVRYSSKGHYVSSNMQPGEYIETRYKTYDAYLVEEDFIQQIIEGISEVPIQREQISQDSELFDNFDLSQSADGYAVSWSVSDDVTDMFPSLETVYVTFNLVPEGEGVDYKNKNGVSQSIGDGFSLDKGSYSFEPRYYDDNFSWGLDWGASYQIIAQLTYQPSEFICDPQVRGACSPVLSQDDSRLANEAKDYLFLSESFILR